MQTRRLEAQIAITLNAGEADDLRNLERKRFLWGAWKRRYWPADVVRPGLKLYAFDKSTRRLVVLLQITRAGFFEYRTRGQLASAVETATGWTPNRLNPYWRTRPISSPNKTACYGVAIRWKVLKRVSMPLDIRFPQLGWLKLTPAALLESDLDPGQAFSEGSRQLRTHMITERNRTLRSQSKRYWRRRLGSVRCLVCGFDFSKVYGFRGADFIEMHHDRPLSARHTSEGVRVADLKPLCANCHRMVHRGAEVLTAQALKALIGRHGGA